MPADTLDVGTISNDSKGRIFIACPGTAYERCTTPITRSVKHVMKLSRDDAEWLIRALRKELRRT